MRITYVTHTRFPTEKAHGYQVAQVCNAMASLGHELTLVAPTVGKGSTQAAFQMYGIPESFQIKKLHHFDALNSWIVPGPLAFAVSMIFYRSALRKYFEENGADFLYVRSPVLLPALLDTRIPIILELHTLPRFGRKRFVRLAGRCRLVVCLTRAMREQVLAWGLDPRRTVTEGDGVDLDRFYNLPEASLAKEGWQLPSDRTVVGYIGSLVTRDTMEKGVAELVDAIALLKQQGRNVFCWIVGGPSSWMRQYEERAKAHGLSPSDIRFQGSIPVKRVPSAIAACNVCVYPAPKSDDPYFMRDTSPLKLFEYLAARKPIACADLPPIRDVVNESLVHFCRPGDAGSLAYAIVGAIENPPKNPSRRAEIVDRHSWRRRMERILTEAV